MQYLKDDNRFLYSMCKEKTKNLNVAKKALTLLEGENIKLNGQLREQEVKLAQLQQQLEPESLAPAVAASLVHDASVQRMPSVESLGESFPLTALTELNSKPTSPLKKRPTENKKFEIFLSSLLSKPNLPLDDKISGIVTYVQQLETCYTQQLSALRPKRKVKLPVSSQNFERTELTRIFENAIKSVQHQVVRRKYF